MNEEGDKNRLIRRLFWFLLFLFISVLVSAGITIIVLLITDSIFYEKTKWQTDSQFQMGFFKRVNWLFAAIVFVISFIGLAISNYASASLMDLSEDKSLRNLKSYANRHGEKANVSVEGNSFFSNFELGNTRFEGKFTINAVIKRPGKMLRYCNSSVSFALPLASDSFEIKRKKSIFGEAGKQISIIALSDDNPTKMLDEKYEYSFNNYAMFRKFLADDEIIKDFLSSAKDSKMTTNFFLKDSRFTIESSGETYSDEERAQRDGVRILNLLFLQAQKYHRRFQQIGLIEEPRES